MAFQPETKFEKWTVDLTKDKWVEYLPIIHNDLGILPNIIKIKHDDIHF